MPGYTQVIGQVIRGADTQEPSTVAVLQGSASDLKKAAHHRDRQAEKAGTIGITVQVLSHALRLLIIPLSIQILGIEQYGLWIVVGSLVAWGGITDLGLAPGLINVVASADAHGDRVAMQRAIATAFAVYGVLAIAVAALAIALSRWSELPMYLGVAQPGLSEDARGLVLVCGLILAASTLTRVVSTTATALQQGYLGPSWHFTGSVASVGILFLLVPSHVSVSTYALAVSLPPVLAHGALAAYLFGWKHRDLRPAWRCCNRATLGALWSFAGPLTVYQFANIAVLYSAPLIISNRLGPAMVTAYSVPYAAFNAVIAPVVLLVSSYLPAYVEAKARGDWHWLLKRTTRLSLTTVALVSLGGLGLVVCGGPAISWWTSGAVQANSHLLFALFFFALFRVTATTTNVVLVGLGKVRLASLTFFGLTIVYIVLSWSGLGVLGVIAIPLAAGAAHLAYTVGGMRWAFQYMKAGQETLGHLTPIGQPQGRG